MPNKLTISPLLSQLDELCPSGYAIALHIHFTTPVFLFQTYEREWIDVYSRKGLVMKDPTVRWGFSNTGVKVWSDLQGDDAEGVLKEAAEFGLKFGFVVALNEGDSKTVASFAREDRDYTESEQVEITQILKELHNCTLNAKSLPAAEIAELKLLSIELTQGGTGFD